MNGRRPQIQVKPISAAQTLPLRLEVLRPSRPAETAHFPGDEDPATRHFGLFERERLVGIASLFSAKFASMPAVTAYQLRGMAIAPTQQRHGLGERLLHGCIDFARSAGAAIIWCNARASAAAFYQKNGFEIVGKEFEIPDVGPHFQMVLRVER
jgi:GNAT superfamily N-acetyltransferase